MKVQTGIRLFWNGEMECFILTVGALVSCTLFLFIKGPMCWIFWGGSVGRNRFIIFIIMLSYLIKHIIKH